MTPKNQKRQRKMRADYLHSLLGKAAARPRSRMPEGPGWQGSAIPERRSEAHGTLLQTMVL